ncbi:MAG: hypothetical protein ACC662_05835, partial [Planctomycetota bacterium]
MRRTCLAIALLVLLPPLAGRGVQAGDEARPPGMTEKQVRVLRSKLRSRAVEWWIRRKKLAMVCPQCRGTGKVRWRRRRRRVLVDCPKCDGHKIYVSKDEYRRCFYDMRSPAYRLQEGIQARATQEFKEARNGNPFPTILEHYAIKDAKVVDATHGIVWVEQNKDSVARPQAWILGKEARKPATWYFYDAVADGPWPTEEKEAAGTPP